jgi:hypothetical protein
MIEKVTPSWLLSSNPCADGHAWGEMFVGPQGKDRNTCLKAMKRADWLLWLLVKTGACELFPLMVELREYAGRTFKSDEAMTLLVDLHLSLTDSAKLMQLNKEAGAAAFELTKIKRDKPAHECSFVSLLALALAAETRHHREKALELTQAAINAMVGAKTGRLDFHSTTSEKMHAELCGRLLSAAKVIE